MIATWIPRARKSSLAPLSFPCSFFFSLLRLSRSRAPSLKALSLVLSLPLSVSFYTTTQPRTHTTTHTTTQPHTHQPLKEDPPDPARPRQKPICAQKRCFAHTGRLASHSGHVFHALDDHRGVSQYSQYRVAVSDSRRKCSTSPPPAPPAACSA